MFSKAHQRAKASLSLDLPSIESLLPYETMDEALLFQNKCSSGFGLHLTPMSGADETLLKSMAQLLKDKLPIDCDCTFLLYRTPFVSQLLEDGLSSMKEAGSVFQTIYELSKAYHLKAAVDGYANGRNIAAHLSDYHVYLFFSKACDNKSIELASLREEVESALSVAGFHHQRLEADHFLKLMRALIAPNLESVSWPDIEHQKDAFLSTLIPQGNSLMHIHDTSIEVEGSDKTGAPFKTQIINCHLEKWPEQLALWQTPDVFANLLEPQHGIPCPFLISMTIRGVSQTKMMSRARARSKSLNANANAIQLFLNPGMKEEREDWNTIYEEGSRDRLALLPMFYNLMLFTHPNHANEALTKSISAYRQLGFELQQSRATQWIRYLASLPFFMTEGFFKDLETLGLIKTLPHENIANLLPIVVSQKGSSQGLLLPTHRNQIAFFDTFDNQTLPITNFNFLTVGSSGAGKSMFQQAQILSGLSMGEITYVIDLGHSYQHLCELVGGTYVDVSNITLNPFTLFDFEGKTDEVADNIQIRDLLAIMASPHEPLSDIQKAYLLEASMHCWQAKGRHAKMDDVLETLSALKTEDTRLSDLITLLRKYGSQGLYGHLFNGDTPFIQNKGLVVFEMSGFQNNPELLSIVMFVMIVIIQGQFYHTDRRIKKRCIIDEAWRFLCEGSNPIAANFIEQGFRTARKHNGGFGVLTQYLLDTEKTIQGQAIAASSDIKIIMRQGNFKAYLREHPNRFTPFQQMMIESFGDVSSSGFSNLMIEAGNTYSFHRYFADPFTRILFSSNGEEFSAIEALRKTGISLEEAVSEVAAKRFGLSCER